MIAENEKLQKALSEAYDYLVRVLDRQGRWLDSKDLYSAYVSMHFKPTLKENVFVDLIETMKRV